MRPRGFLAALLALPLAALALATCKRTVEGGGGEEPPSLYRLPDYACPAALDGYLTVDGTGALARPAQAEDLIGGEAAQGRVGDYALANDKIRVIIQGLDRHIGPQPWGGNIIDADLVRPGPGRDGFGELGLIYNFGRTVNPDHVDVLRDGAAGGSALIAASGRDALNDFLNIKIPLRAAIKRVPQVDPEIPLPLRITHYYVLNPGEQVVRYVSALCNEGPDEVVLAVGDMADPGGSVEYFNGQSCTGGFGSGGLCGGLDGMSWYGFQGDGVAYGYVPYRSTAPGRPEPNNAVIVVSGQVLSLLSAPGMNGLLAWLDPTVSSRAGELRIPPGQSRTIARDFVVGRDLGEIASQVALSRAPALNESTGGVSATVSSAGQPLAGARVTFERGGAREAVFVADDQGAIRGALPAGTYTVSAWAPGRAPSAPQTAELPPRGTLGLSFEIGVTRRLSVSVSDTLGNPLPAKVTVLCLSRTCLAPSSRIKLYTDILRDPLPDNVQLIGMVSPSGHADFWLPEDQYQVVVSRGPEYSLYPNDWPQSRGAFMDLRGFDGALNAVLSRVIDSTGYMSADFHVHAVNSPDSFIPNVERVGAFLSEGVDVLVATDHDYVTDLAPYNAALGGQGLMATVVGDEVTPMAYGHYIAFPVNRDEGDLNGGAIDWAGGGSPALTLGRIFDLARQKGARTVQFNHPRGKLGGFDFMKVDTDTFATHELASTFRIDEQPGSSAADTKLFSLGFNTLELLNGGIDHLDARFAHSLFNDWLTMLSRGVIVAGCGTSDTHQRFAGAAGYWRTFVHTGVDAPAQLTPNLLSQPVNALDAFASNAPFVRLSARALDATGAPLGAAVGMGQTLPTVGASQVEVAIEVQVPSYLDVTRIEIFTHVPSDDGRCPVDPQAPWAAKTRVACNGVPNLSWPSDGLVAAKDIQLATGDLKVVETVNGVSYQRYQVQQSFRIPAPATDNWLVAMVYGSAPLFPLVYAGLDGSNGAKPVLPFAFTNPIFLDADGGGYDHPPFRVPLSGRRLPLPARPPLRTGKVDPSEGPELMRFLDHH